MLNEIFLDVLLHGAVLPTCSLKDLVSVYILYVNSAEKYLIQETY